jgi:hypothetical protein
MKLKILLFLALLFGLVPSVSVNVVLAQTLPVGLMEGTDDVYRRQQLLGLDSTNASYMVRPLIRSDWNKLLYSGMDGKLEVKALPVVWQQQINSHHPYGMNDGLMIPAKGYQTMFSAGVHLKAGPLTIQLRPELVYAANSYFRQTYEADNEPVFKNAINNYYSLIDAPERFGEGSYSKASWGQSSIRLNFDPVSIGVSNENLWWGPGVRNSLLMSNNAPGFKHVTLNTTRPVNTPIGSFESQIIAGRLDGSGIVGPSGVRHAKFSDWRYLSGIVFVYQPKWVKGLYLGFDRTFTTYRSDMGSSFGDYFPLFSGFDKKSTYDPDSFENSEDAYARDQIFSLFMRWVMPESNSEIYFQYGREDHAWDSRDAFVEPEHSRAYIAGFRKLIPLTDKGKYIQAGLELTQLEQAKSSIVRGAGSWYSHGEIKHGYTHQGQYLGAGIGPDNMQSLSVSWVNVLKRIGLQIERRVHNNELYYRMFNGKTEPRRHWVDLGIGGNLDWDYKNFILNAQMVYTHSYNYQYRVENQDPNIFWDFDKQDAGNLHLKVGLMYRW